MLNSVEILALALAGRLDDIAALARQEIAIESAKATGGATMAARQKKALMYINSCDRPENAGTFTQEYSGTGYQCFTNGFTGFLLNHSLPGLPESQKPFDLVKCLPIGGDALEDFPSQLAEARRLIAEHKAATKGWKGKGKPKQPPIVIGKCGYNPQYLLDVAAILGGDITMYQDDSKPTSPARLESENGIAILLPVRLK